MLNIIWTAPRDSIEKVVKLLAERHKNTSPVDPVEYACELLRELGFKIV